MDPKDRSEELATHARDLQMNGFCLLENVIPAEMCADLRDRLMAISQRKREETPAATKISFVPGVINYDQSFALWLADDRILALATDLFGPHVRISFTSSITNEPGKQRTNWHADWPFNQNNAGHVPAPYPDRVMHLTAITMVSPFTVVNGGTLVVPGSHRFSSNPSDAGLGIDPNCPYPTEYRVTGDPGTTLLFDSRVWHCSPANPSNAPRVALVARYAPWWLNLAILDPDSNLRRQMVTEPGLNNNIVPRIPRTVYATLPEKVQPLYRHWVKGNDP